jgi:hypothetical protein
MFCWGYNKYGQLGTGNLMNVQEPTPVNAFGVLKNKAVTAASAGTFHSCALADGQAFCWGAGNHGELGTGTTWEFRDLPAAVDTAGPLKGKVVTAIASGASHSCAVADMRAYCWGSNEYGQLGNNSTAQRSLVPVAVTTTGVLSGKSITTIASSEHHTAVLAATAPQPPTTVTAMAGNMQATVSWSAPGDDGGSRVTEYVATGFPGGSSCSSAATSCTVAGLSNGTAYTFTVTARNAIGMSDPSAASAPVTPTAAITPKTRVIAKPKAGRSKLKVRVKPNLGKKKQWTFVVKQRRHGKWRTVKTKSGKIKVYATRGPKHIRVINLGKGKYKARSRALRGYRPDTSKVVKLTR